MDRKYDEVISDMLIQLEQIDKSLKETLSRMSKGDRRLDLTIKRMVKAESRLETHEKRMETQDRRMETFDKKLEQSIKDQKAQSQLQAKANAYFLKQLTQQTKVLDSILKRNGRH